MLFKKGPALSFSKGFTLIELLVVVSIISILSVVGLVSFQGIQSRTRDSQRKQDLRILASASEIYFQKNGGYIDGTPVTEGNCSSADTTTFYTSIVPYMSAGSVPKDSKTGEFYCYISLNSGQSFRFFAKLENSSDPDGLTCGSIRYYTVFSQDLTSTCPP